MLDKEFQYYIDHQNELLKQYSNKVLVIVGEEVMGVFDTELDAYFDSIAKFKPGTFLIQKCTPGEESYTQTFYSPRLIFA
jgi:hypothetical protein